MRILLTGVNGQVGGDLLPLLSGLGTVIAPSRSELDLSQPHAITSFVEKIKPDWIVNAAAYTAVDKAESEPELAYSVNAEAPRALGIGAAKLDIPVLHFSTDYVFDGSGTRPWVETDATGPLGVYGASKLAGEQALAESGAAYLIFRTSWVYSAGGKNFLLTILRHAQQKDELRIVNDQHGAPTWSRDLANMVLHIFTELGNRSATHNIRVVDELRKVRGIYHAAGTGNTTWYGFASEFLRVAAGRRPDLKFARLTPIPGSEYPTPATRPGNSRLNCGRLQREFGVVFPRWQDSTARVVRESLPERAFVEF